MSDKYIWSNPLDGTMPVVIDQLTETASGLIGMFSGEPVEIFCEMAKREIAA